MARLIFTRPRGHKGIKPIIGCEVYVAPGQPVGKEDQQRRPGRLSSSGAAGQGRDGLPESDQARHRRPTWRAITTSRASIRNCWRRTRKGSSRSPAAWPAKSRSRFRKTSCPKRARPLTGSSRRSARRISTWNCKTTALPEQAKVNRHLIAWAKEFGLKLVATNDVHYVEKNHSHAHDCLICIGTQTPADRHQAAALRRAAVLSALGGGNEGAFRRDARGGAEHARGGREVQPGDRVRQAALPGFRPAGALHPRRLLAAIAGRGLLRRYGMRARAEGEEFIVEGIEDPDAAADLSGRPRVEAEPASRVAGITPHAIHGDRAAAAVKAMLDRLRTRTEGHREDRVHQLLPDRRRFRPLRPRTRASPAWRAVRRPVRSSPTCWRSPTWTPSATGCCSSAFSIPNASTRRISTLISPTTAART